MASRTIARSSLKIFREPQCLIDTAKDGRLEVKKDLIAELQSLHKSLVVIAIAGLYRTGKSYLMNRLAGKTDGKGIAVIAEINLNFKRKHRFLCCLLKLVKSMAIFFKGFALGSTIESKTKGIWIWVCDHPDYSDRYLVLLDTEGLGDVKKVILFLLFIIYWNISSLSFSINNSEIFIHKNHNTPWDNS